MCVNLSQCAGKIAAIGLSVALGIASIPSVAMAQKAPRGSFAPVKYVNNQAVTAYELSQRMAFLKLLGFQGDLRNEAMNGLIDDRLRMSVAKRLGLTLSSEAVTAGMEEFAARGNLNAQQFIEAITKEGIAPETFRDFVSAGLIWRDVVQSRFAESIVISDAAVKRALTNLNVAEAQTVALAEIVLDASPANRDRALAVARDLQIDFIKGRAFSDAARRVSIGATARSGGVLGPKLLSQLPNDVAVAVRSLNPGQMSKPMIIDDRLYLYQMLESGTKAVAQTGGGVIDYAEVALKNTAQAGDIVAKLRQSVDTCDDLYAYADRAGGMVVTRKTQPQAGISPDAARILTLLDTGEISGDLVRGDTRVAVMLCARGLQPDQTASPDEVKLLLKNQRLGAMADIYLSELRSDALIRDP